MWMQQAASTSLQDGAALEVLRVLLALAGVCALALWALRWLASRGVGRAGQAGRVQVVERVALDAQRALYLVRVDGRTLLLGTGPGAAPALLAELDADDARVPLTAVAQARHG